MIRNESKFERRLKSFYSISILPFCLCSTSTFFLVSFSIQTGTTHQLHRSRRAGVRQWRQLMKAGERGDTGDMSLHQSCRFTSLYWCQTSRKAGTYNSESQTTGAGQHQHINPESFYLFLSFVPFTPYTYCHIQSVFFCFFLFIYLSI